MDSSSAPLMSSAGTPVALETLALRSRTRSASSRLAAAAFSSSTSFLAFSRSLICAASASSNFAALALSSS